MSDLDALIERGKTDPIGATVEMVKGLMRGDPATLKLGYSIGNALIAAQELIFGKYPDLPTEDEAILIERVVNETTIHYSATPRPLVVALMDGGLVQGSIELPGLGTPEFEVLDFDREGEDPEDTAEFVERANGVFAKLAGRGVEPNDYWREMLERFRADGAPVAFDAAKHWPVDHHEMGKE